MNCTSPQETPESGTVQNLLGSWEKRASQGDRMSDATQLAMNSSNALSPTSTRNSITSPRRQREKLSPRRVASSTSGSSTSSGSNDNPKVKKSGAPKFGDLLNAYEKSHVESERGGAPSRRRQSSQNKEGTAGDSPSKGRKSVLDRYKPHDDMVPASPGSPSRRSVFPKKVVERYVPTPANPPVFSRTHPNTNTPIYPEIPKNIVTTITTSIHHNMENDTPTVSTATTTESMEYTMDCMDEISIPREEQEKNKVDQALPMDDTNGQDVDEEQQVFHSTNTAAVELQQTSRPAPTTPELEPISPKATKMTETSPPPQTPPRVPRKSPATKQVEIASPKTPLQKPQAQPQSPLSPQPLNLFLDELSVMAMLIKPSPKSNLGIELAHRRSGGNSGSKDWRILITKLDPRGLLAKSDLRVGQTLLAINGIPANDFTSSDEAMQTLSEARRVVIVATKSVSVSLDISSMMAEGSTSSSLAAGMIVGETMESVLFIKHIADLGLVRATTGSVLQVGMKIIAMNDQNNLNLFQANQLLQGKTSSRIVTILAIEDEYVDKELAQSHSSVPSEAATTDGTVAASPPPIADLSNQLTLFLDESSAVGTVVKPTRETRLGIGFTRRPRDWRIIISVLTEDSLLANSDLKLGQTLLAVNGTPATEFKSAKEVRQCLEASIDVNIVATKSILATVNKKAALSPVGISFRYHARKKGGILIIHQVSSDGLFGQKGLLQVGMKVVAINDKPCPESLEAANAIIKYCVGPLTIVGVFDEECPEPN